MPLAGVAMGRRLRLLKRKKSLYESVTDPAEIEAYQLCRFNEVWARACAGHNRLEFSLAELIWSKLHD